MKKRSPFFSSLSVYLFFMIGVMAFVRGNKEQILIIIGFCIWTIYIIISYSIKPISKLYLDLKDKYSKKNVYSNIPINTDDIDVKYKNVLETLLNENIDVKLSSVFPDSKWTWKNGKPTSFIENGTTSIITENTNGYQSANISINSENRLDYNMIKVKNLKSFLNEKDSTQTKSSEEIDVYSWFTNIGQQKIKEIVTDLMLKDFREFKIKEDGSVLITENNSEIKTTAINSIPPKSQWATIIPLIKDIGYIGFIKNDELIINW